jgi:hypothetical protein
MAWQALSRDSETAQDAPETVSMRKTRRAGKRIGESSPPATGRPGNDRGSRKDVLDRAGEIWIEAELRLAQKTAQGNPRLVGDGRGSWGGKGGSLMIGV